MPDYIGAGSEFIGINNIPKYENDMIQLDEMTNEKTLVGYLFGGIKSDVKNIFWTNFCSQSIANETIFKLYVHKTTTTGIADLENDFPKESSQLLLYPNTFPNSGILNVEIDLVEISQLHVEILNEEGKLLKSIELMPARLQLGQNNFEVDLQFIGEQFPA